jgi:hypothetical protein
MEKEKSIKVCVFCGRGEGYICSLCSQKILSMNYEQIKSAYALTIEKGLTAKAEVLLKIIEEEEYVPKTGKARSDLVRERPVRTSRPAYHEIRA